MIEQIAIMHIFSFKGPIKYLLQNRFIHHANIKYFLRQNDHQFQLRGRLLRVRKILSIKVRIIVELDIQVSTFFLPLKPYETKNRMHG